MVIHHVGSDCETSQRHIVAQRIRHPAKVHRSMVRDGSSIRSTLLALILMILAPFAAPGSAHAQVTCYAGGTISSDFLIYFSESTGQCGTVNGSTVPNALSNSETVALAISPTTDQIVFRIHYYYTSASRTLVQIASQSYFTN